MLKTSSRKENSYIYKLFRIINPARIRSNNIIHLGWFLRFIIGLLLISVSLSILHLTLPFILEHSFLQPSPSENPYPDQAPGFDFGYNIFIFYIANSSIVFILIFIPFSYIFGISATQVLLSYIIYVFISFSV